MNYENSKSLTDVKFKRLVGVQRMLVENVLAQFKVFKVFSSRYRNRLKRLGLRLNLIAGTINMELGF